MTVQITTKRNANHIEQIIILESDIWYNNTISFIRPIVRQSAEDCFGGVELLVNDIVSLTI